MSAAFYKWAVIAIVTAFILQAIARYWFWRR
jgi:hypothetical protein